MDLGLLQAQGRIHTTHFVGFDLPQAAWHADEPACLALPEVQPDEESLLETAWTAIQRSYGYIGRVEAFGKHLDELFQMLDWAPAQAVYINMSDIQRAPDAADLQAVERYAALDRRLYERIANLQGGRFLREDRLRSSDAYALG